MKHFVEKIDHGRSPGHWNHSRGVLCPVDVTEMGNLAPQRRPPARSPEKRSREPRASICTLPEQVQALAASYLAPQKDMGSARVALRYGEDVAELACWFALRGQDAELLGDETWRSLYALCRSLVEGLDDKDDGLSAPEDGADRAAAAAVDFVLLGRGDVEGVFAARVAHGALLVERAGIALLERRGRAAPRRLVAAARRLGEVAWWEIATPLLAAALERGSAASAPADGPAPPRASALRRVLGRLARRPTPEAPSPDPAPAVDPRWSAQLAIDASTFLVDKLYASTYCFAGDDDASDVYDALAYARRARDALAYAVDAATGEAAGGADAAAAPAAALASLALQRFEAAFAVGRAAALCAQHGALEPSLGPSGAIPEDWRDVFDEGQAAFDAAASAAAAAADDLAAARARAGLGELMYCRASALSRQDIRTADDLFAMMRHARVSVWMTADALDTIRGLGLGESRYAVTFLKDMGKVHGFIASIFGVVDFGALGSRGPIDLGAYRDAPFDALGSGGPMTMGAAESRAHLDEAYRIQKRLASANVRETENICRLLANPALTDRPTLG